MLKGFAHAVFKTKFFGSGLTLHDGNSLIERLEIDGSNLMMISLRYLLFFISHSLPLHYAHPCM